MELSNSLLNNRTYELSCEKYRTVYKEDLRSLDKSTFIVCAMFTPHKHELILCADRLSRSCTKYELPFIIYTVPEIHKSLSPAGKNDPSFTRTNLIFVNLMRFPGKNILCLDADMFFLDYPAQIEKVSEAGFDLAIYNWLHDEHNEAYVPINGRLETDNRHSDFYVFSHSINFLSGEQLISSGGVQFYRNSSAARRLLELWQQFITHYPEYAEDQCLDFVYNNFIAGKNIVKTFWLDKSYLRFPWWPHVKPVIIHPGLPSHGRNIQLEAIGNHKRFYPEKCRKNTSDFTFPADYIIDTRNGFILKFSHDRLVERKPIHQKFWIYPENAGIE